MRPGSTFTSAANWLELVLRPEPQVLVVRLACIRWILECSEAYLCDVVAVVGQVVVVADLLSLHTEDKLAVLEMTERRRDRLLEGQVPVLLTRVQVGVAADLLFQEEGAVGCVRHQEVDTPWIDDCADTCRGWGRVARRRTVRGAGDAPEGPAVHYD